MGEIIAQIMQDNIKREVRTAYLFQQSDYWPEVFSLILVAAQEQHN